MSKILYKNIYCKSTKNEWKGSHNKIVWLKFVLTQDSWQQLESDSTSWQRTLKSSHNLQNQWHVVSTLCQEMKNHLTRKVGFEGTPKLDPCQKSQPATCKVDGKLPNENPSRTLPGNLLQTTSDARRHERNPWSSHRRHQAWWPLVQRVTTPTLRTSWRIIERPATWWSMKVKFVWRRNVSDVFCATFNEFRWGVRLRTVTQGSMFM